MSYESEYIYQPLMGKMGSLRPSDFGDSAPVFVADAETIESTAPKLNQKVQEARLALAEVAIAMGHVTKERLEKNGAFQQNTSMSIPGIDSGVLSDLDGLDRKSSDESILYEREKYLQKALDVLDWFDAIDDGTPLRLIQREQSGERVPAGIKEQFIVTHSYLRKVGDVYELSRSQWKSNEFRANAKTQSSTENLYFQRTEDDDVSRVVTIGSKDYDHLSSPLFNSDSIVLPSNIFQAARSLESFQKYYSMQQRIAPTLSLLEALPVKRAHQGVLSEDRRRQLYSERTVRLEDGRLIDVAMYGAHQKDITPTAISLKDRKTFQAVTLDYDKQDIYVYNAHRKEDLIGSSLVDEVNAQLREEVLQHEEIA